MTNAFELRNVTKRFGKKVALDSVSLAVAPRSIIGLIGRNGSGKTSLLRHVTGLYLPTTGECETLGCATPDLGPSQLSRIGAVNQHDSFIEWMKVEQFLRYMERFYNSWDRELENHLVNQLEVDVSARLGTLSPGGSQKVGLIVATCHHPSLLLLDEPLSDLDPIVRTRTVSMLLDRFSDDDLTMVISSHMLHDIERIVDRIVCLDGGRIVADAPLDDLRERYAEWLIASPAGTLPSSFSEDFVISSEGDGFHARLVVRHSDDLARAFASNHDATLQVSRLTLEQIFPLIVGSAEASGSGNTIDLSEPRLSGSAT